MYDGVLGPYVKKNQKKTDGEEGGGGIFREKNSICEKKQANLREKTHKSGSEKLGKKVFYSVKQSLHVITLERSCQCIDLIVPGNTSPL